MINKKTSSTIKLFFAYLLISPSLKNVDIELSLMYAVKLGKKFITIRKSNS